MGDAVGGFIKGFMAGWEMIPSKSEREYEQAKTRYTNAMAKYYEEGGKSSDTSARDANYNSQIQSRAARDAELVRHNKAMESKAGTSAFKKEEAPLEVPETALGTGEDLNEDAPAEEFEDVIPGLNKGGPVQALPPRMRVQRYANGGGVVGEEEMVDPQPAVPLTAAAIPMAPGTRQLAPEVTPPPAQPAVAAGGGVGMPPAAEEGPGFSYTAVVDAAKVGLAGIAEEGGDKEKASTRAIPGPKDKPTSKGTTPASIEEIKALDKVVDSPEPGAAPKPKLSESQRNAKKLAWGYEHYLQQGDIKKAKEYAVAMVKTFEDLRNRFNTIAAAKADQGDVDGAIGAALRAYAYVPDGMEVTLQKSKDGRFAYKYTDNVTGKVVSKGLKTPEEMLAIVTAGAASSMEDLVARASDMRQTLDPGVADAVVTGEKPKAAINLEEAKAIGATKAKRDAATAKANRYKDVDADKKADAAAKAAKKDAEVAAKNEKAATKDAERKAAAETKAAAKYTRDTPASPVTQMDFDALPAGAWFINPKDGNLRQKKKAAAPAAGE
jgi:hypothetical protein